MTRPKQSTMTDTDTEMTFVRVGSHRAGEKLRRYLGGADRDYKLDYHYTWETGGNLVPVPASKLAGARAITGITKAKLKDAPRRCISMR